MKLVVVGIVMVVACKSEDRAKAQDKAKEVGTQVEAEAKRDEKLAAKPIAAIGQPVDFPTAMQTLCDAVPIDGKDRTADERAALIKDAMEHHPNTDVLKFVGKLGSLSLPEQGPAFAEQIKRAGLKTCRAYDEAEAKGPPQPFVDAMQALCDAVPAATPPAAFQNKLVAARDAYQTSHPHPSPDVMGLWSEVGTKHDAAELGRFKAHVDFARLKACRLGDQLTQK